MLAEWSKITIDDRGELGFAISGELLRRGMADYQQLEPSLPDSFLRDDVANEAHLLGHSTDSGMIRNGGYSEVWPTVNSGEMEKSGR
jgi:hypothetical protein